MIEEKIKGSQFVVDLREFNIPQTTHITAMTREEAYEIAAKKLMIGVTYIPPMMPKMELEVLDYCADQVFKHTGINLSTLRSPLRSRAIVPARHAMWWLALREGIKRPYIAAYLNRERSTSYNSMDNVEGFISLGFDKTYKWLKKVEKYDAYNNRD
jgi:hypothetical protein